MATSTMRFKRGDINVHYFKMPLASWNANGVLSFAAKPQVDNDDANSAAVIIKSFTDSDIIGNSHPKYDAEHATYELVFNPSDISSSLQFQDGETRREFVGEFQFVPSGGMPQSFPNTDDFIQVIIFADIRRGS